MATLNLTTFASALKTLYTDKKIETLVYESNPFLAMVPKNENFEGTDMKVPLLYGNIKGRAADFTTAQANKAASDWSAFTATRVRDYGLASIDNETLEASRSNKGAFLRAAQAEIDSAFRAVGRSMAGAVYRTGTGSIGRVGSTSTTTLTLATVSDVVHFEKGMQIQASAADGGTLRDIGDYITITAIDRDAGTLTGDANWSNIASIGNGDYLYIKGDAQNNASTRTKLSGLLAWLPTTAPSATSFFGVDRSTDVVRLGGVRYDGSALTHQEALINGVSRVGVEGGKTDYLFANPVDVRTIINSMTSFVQYTEHKVGDIGFQGVRVMCDGGPIPLIADLNCPQGYAFALQMNTWELATLGKAPKLLDSDGNKFLRDGAADSVEVRVGMYGQLVCHAPGYNAVITLPTAT